MGEENYRMRYLYSDDLDDFKGLNRRIFGLYQTGNKKNGYTLQQVAGMKVR